MADSPDRSPGRIDPIDPRTLENRLREVARARSPERLIDPLELNHLVRVVTECSLLLTDVYSEERIARIMQPERGFLRSIIDKLIENERRGDGEVLYRVRRLPEDVRVVGDKALFDHGMLGLRSVRGLDLADLGARAYRMAGEVLKLLAEDRRLRSFFEHNRLLMLPIEEEVVFLRQCSDNFGLYADILRATHPGRPTALPRDVHDLARRVPLMAAAAEALEEERRTALPVVDAADGAEAAEDAYVAAARGEGGAEADLSREQMLSVYERMLLFSGLRIDRLREALDRTVIDQPRAVQTLCDEFSLFAAGTRDLRKPPAFFLVGPTGVGKNHLVESLRRLLGGIWGVEIPLLTIEGPNYTYPSDINELRGATRGFIRSDEEGLLTAFHEKSSRAPFSVILVDEVEKAHAQLLTFFLPILDRGTTTDNRGNVLNFANCVLFFTSNLGYSDAQQRSAPIGYGDEEARTAAADKDIRKELRRALKPEFVNRVRLVHFDRLTRASAERILDLELARIARRYETLHGLRLEVGAAAREELIRRGFSATFGARHLAATLETVCNVEIAKLIGNDPRPADPERERLIAWLREMRAGNRAYDAAEVRDRVLRVTRASLDYDTLRIAYAGGRFEYVPARGAGDGAADAAAVEEPPP